MVRTGGVGMQANPVRRRITPVRTVAAATEPHAGLTDPDARRLARLLARVALFMATVMSVASVTSVTMLVIRKGIGGLGPLLPDPGAAADPRSTLLIMGSAVAFWICVPLCRSRRFQSGATAMMVTLSAFIFVMGVLNPESADNLVPGFAVAVLVTTFTVDARRTIVQFVIAAVLGLTLIIVTDVPAGRFGAVVGITGTIMALTVVVALRRENDLRQVVKLRALERKDAERIRHELDLARRVQIAMLPEAAPTVPGLDIAAYSQPAYEASGDFYDLFEVTDQSTGRGSIAIVVADVAGKGIASALVMSAAKVAIRAEAIRSSSPAEVLAAVNGTLVASIPPSLFVTACVVLYDPDTRSLRHASAGHPHPLHWSRETDAVAELEAFGLPLGLAADSTYTDRQTHLACGDVVVMVTDGVIEALDPTRRMYGFDRAEQDVRNAARTPGTAQDRLDALLGAVSTFLGQIGDSRPDHVGDLDLEDDLTVLAMAVTDEMAGIDAHAGPRVTEPAGRALE